MSMIRKVRRQLKEMGFRSHMREEIDSLGTHLTICQFVVVVLSIVSVVFLFVPFFYLQNKNFMIAFFAISLASLTLGIWFWVHQVDICEHPEDYQD